MSKRKSLIFVTMGLAIAAFCCGVGQVAAQPAPVVPYAPNIVPNPAMGFNPNVNYTLPNFSQSPNLRKFVDSLPGLGLTGCTPGIPSLNYTDGTCNQNNLGQYIPIAVPDTTTYPGSVFYNVAVGNFAVQMHSDLPPTGTALRGYQQVKGTGPGQTPDPAIGGVGQYLGPAIVARVYNPTLPPGAPTTLNPFGVGGNGWPVRLKFDNTLPLSNSTATCATDPAHSSKLCLPVDPTLMGAGMGPLGPAPYGTTTCDMGVQMNCDTFTENRATIPHLHGGRTPWISDGTPHQWITPAGDPIPGTAITGYPWGMKKGPALTNVPDMIGAGAGHVPNTANDGTATNYYTNQQSARLLFWHDHVWGITRLNVYKGMAAPYLLIDQVEDDLIDGSNYSGGNPAAKQILPNLGGVYRYGIPLVIQDKGFVNDASTDALRSPNFPIGTYDPTSHTYETTAVTPGAATGDCWNPVSANYYLKVSDSRCGTDPLWYKYVGSKGGQLWMPHEYMPVENIYDPTGNLTNGRWDYGPFLIPPMMPTNLVLPSPTITPEALLDTMIVNGTAFPYIELPPDVIRFRILSVPNDRVTNLQWYKADPLTISIKNRGSGYAVPPALPPAVTITNAPGDTGTFTSATATVSTGVITDIAPDRNCVDFTAPPTVTLTPQAADLATATCTLPITAVIMSNSNGAVTGFQGVDSCTGFTLAPTVTVSGGGGVTCNATATVVPPGQLLGITVTDATGYHAAPTVTIAAPAAGTRATVVAWANTEVKMVDAAPNPAYPTWPTDGRDGGVPDPTTQGPPWILIGNEGGLLAQASVIPPQPVDFEYIRQNIPFSSVTSHSLLLLPDHRADVLVDFRNYPDGTTFILYNDAPAPMPSFWPNNDYYTDDPDQRAVGAQPTTPPGFGPNTRTIMQVRIKGTKTSPFNFDLNALKTAIPKAFAVAQPKPIVPQVAYNDAFPGFAAKDIYVQAPDSTLNLTGKAQTIARIKSTAPGNNYTVAPKVVIIGDSPVAATATAGLNPCGGVTLLTAGSGYTSAPTCTIGAPGAGGVRATCVATVSGGIVNAIQIDEPGSNYSTVKAATCTITGGGGTGATCSTFVAVTNTMGSITVTNPPGVAYSREPRVYIVPNNPGGMGASAVALLNGAGIFTYENITEGFDPDYGRLDIRMGSTPNPLTPTVGAGMVMGLARYIDPPTEILNDGEVTLWRITHLGVDSHALHFHLFDVQVINRIDWTNVVKPPYPDELGWRDTIRTNPMEDIVVAFRPVSTILPFTVPTSNRLLDPTTPVNSVTNFFPIAPPAGVAAVPQVSNIMTNFGWEYVYHCHMLSHEENDFMRPIVFTGTVPPAPSGLAAAVTFPTPTTARVALSWTGSFATATGFTIQRATNSTFTTGLTTFTTTGTPPPNSYTDNTVAQGTAYYYRVQSSNVWGSSAWATIGPAATVLAPSGLTAAVRTNTSVVLTWVNNTTTGTSGVSIQYATDAAFTAGLKTVNVNTPNLTTRNITLLKRKTTYYFRVATTIAVGNSGWSNVAPVTMP